MSDLVFVQSYAPHGSIKGQEVLDACLMGSAFARCALVFLGDGILQVMAGQDTDALGVKDYSVSYGVLKDYGVEKVYCLDADLKGHDLQVDQLKIEVEVLSASELQQVLTSAKQVLTF